MSDELDGLVTRCPIRNSHRWVSGEFEYRVLWSDAHQRWELGIRWLRSGSEEFGDILLDQNILQEIANLSEQVRRR